MLTVKEAAALLGVSQATIYRRIRQKRLTPHPVNPALDKGSGTLLDRSEVLALLPASQ